VDEETTAQLWTLCRVKPFVEANLVLLQALMYFAQMAGRRGFRPTDLHAPMAELLGKTTESYTLGQLRYDLEKLRGERMVEHNTATQSSRLSP
jgi:hypothetical protein